MTTQDAFTDIVQWRSTQMPMPLDALILPEDTYLLLQAESEALDPNATPLDLWVALERARTTEKHPLGSSIIADGRTHGVKYVARVIMVDFDDEPVCRKEVVVAGLHGALSELAKRGCETIGVFRLRGMRGGLSQEEYLMALHQVGTRLGGEPRRLYLLEEGPGRPEDPEV